MTDDVKLSVRELAKDLESCYHVEFLRIRDYYRTDDDGKPLDPADLEEFSPRYELETVDKIEDADFAEISSSYVYDGDYGSGLVGKSNFDVLRNADTADVLDTTGTGWNGHGLVFKLNAMVDEEQESDVTTLVEMVKGLNDYPLIDDSDYSEKEMEAIDEDWKNYGAADLFNKIRCILPDVIHRDSDYDAGKLFELYMSWGDSPHPDGDEIYFPFNERKIQELDPIELIATGVVIVDWQEVSTDVLSAYVTAKDLCVSSLASATDQTRLNECWDDVRSLSELLDAVQLFKIRKPATV
jgi:hypothetical protein